MSRSGYSDDLDYQALNLYRGCVDRAIRGARGQAMLRELVSALDALPNKRLIQHDLEKNGEVCALGAVARLRGMDVSNIDVESPTQVGKAFGIARSMAAEIEFENDEDFGCYPERTPEDRWTRMRAWAVSNIIETP